MTLIFSNPNFDMIILYYLKIKTKYGCKKTT